MAAEGVLRFALSGLTELITEEATEFRVLREGISNLQSILLRTIALFRDASQRLVDEVAHKLVAEIRDACYDVEDVIDDSIEDALSSRRRRGGFKDVLVRYICGSGDPVTPKNIAGKIASITERIEKIHHLLQYYVEIRPTTENENLLEAYRRLQLSRTSHLLEDEDVVGLQDNLSNIVSLLLDKGSEQPVIAMRGMGGSGKTKLAKLIYNHDRIRGHFKGFAWVTVSKMSRTKSVLQDTLVQLVPEHSKEISHFEDITLAEMVCEAMKSRKCLVVLDDIWTSQVWKTLRVTFSYHETDSKVLVTTRSNDVATIISAGNGYRYEMPVLSMDQSWQLFRMRAFPMSNPDTKDEPTIKTMGMDMVKKCGGLPLAIITLGNLLASKSLSQWEMVHKNIDSYQMVDEGSVEFLSMSYNDLPYYLRLCFLYLGTFPKNFEIEAETLYLLWMADGIFSVAPEEANMGLAIRSLDELASRRMVHAQVDEVPTVRRFKSCSLQNLTHDFCLTKAEKDDDFKVLDLRHSNIMYQDSNLPSSTRKIRRLAMYLDKYEDGYPIRLKQKVSRITEIADQLESLFFLNAYHHDQCVMWPEEMINLEEIILLRVLTFDGCSFQTRTLPKGIEKLGKLRYLSLRGCYVEELQPYIGNLLNLRTLDLRVTTSCKMIIPDILWKLERLRHLYLPVAFQAKGSDKLRFAGLKMLQILKNFDTRVCNAQHLLELTDIQILDATTSRNNEDLKVMIEFLKRTSNNTCQLTLDVRNFDCYSEKRRSIVTELFGCSGVHTLHIDGHIGKLPCMDFSGLYKLFFRGSELLADPIPTLGKLPNLLVLALRDAAYLGEVMICSASGFPELRWLELSGLHKLQRLTFEERAMHSLTTLEIERCKSLQVPPDGLDFLDSLQELKIARMPTKFEDEIRKVKENEVQLSLADDGHKERSATWSLVIS